MGRYQQLSRPERYTISDAGERRKRSLRWPGRLSAPPVTVLRERRRNSCNSDGHYRAEIADSYATARRKRERRGFRHTPEQWQQVRALLEEKWSPQQIAGRLRLEGQFTISHETIYQYIWADKKRGGHAVQEPALQPQAAAQAAQYAGFPRNSAWQAPHLRAATRGRRRARALGTGRETPSWGAICITAP